MNAVRALGVAFIFLLGTGGCAEGADCPTPAPGAGAGPIPECILEKANQVVISRLGEARFREQVVFQPALSRYEEADPFCVQNPSNCTESAAQPRYRMAYSLRLPDLPGEDLPVAFDLDAAGNLVTDAVMDGLPDCVRDGGECAFAVVDAAAAISIAQAAGMEPGLGAWRTHFHWYAGEFNTYVWTVENTLTTDASTGVGGGRTFVIDANSGMVLQIFDWQAIP